MQVVLWDGWHLNCFGKRNVSQPRLPIYMHTEWHAMWVTLSIRKRPKHWCLYRRYFLAKYRSNQCGMSWLSCLKSWMGPDLKEFIPVILTGCGQSLIDVGHRMPKIVHQLKASWGQCVVSSCSIANFSRVFWGVPISSPKQTVIWRLSSPQYW